jgi:hypothetical protein
LKRFLKVRDKSRGKLIIWIEKKNFSIKTVTFAKKWLRKVSHTMFWYVLVLF